LHNIYAKLGVANRTALATLAIAYRDRFTPR
jgi:DNA-binding CsgD family transcriptional regulator